MRNSKVSGKHIVFAVLMIIWLIVIFAFSCRTADESTEDSWFVGMLFGKLFVPGFKGWTAEKQLEFAALIDHPVRKIAHATEYAVLGFLSFMTLAGLSDNLLYRKLKAKTAESKGRAQVMFNCFTAWIISVLYAATDEFHQLFVEGRSGQFSDVCIDGGGALFAVVICGIVTLVLLSKSEKKIHESDSK